MVRKSEFGIKLILKLFPFSVILVLLYVSVLVLHIYRAHRKRLIRRLTEYVEHGTMGDLLLGGRELVATIWDAHAWLWHGYELWGLENLPAEVSCGWWTAGHVTTSASKSSIRSKSEGS